MWPASDASAMVDIGLSFEPTTVIAGNRVVVSASIANLGDQREHVSLSLSVTAWGQTFGPKTKSVWLDPYESHSGWKEVLIPRCFPPGVYVFTVTATALDGTDTVVATLAVLPSDPPCNRWSVTIENNLWVDTAMSGILDMYNPTLTPVGNSTWGRIKTLFQ